MKQFYQIAATVVLLLALAGGIKACKVIKEYSYSYSYNDFAKSIEDFDIDRVEKYLGKGYKATSETGKDRQLITFANPATSTGRDIISLLLAQGADINSKYILTSTDYLGNTTGTYESSLLYHASEGDIDAVKFLLENKANPDITINPDNKTSLMIAARKGEQKVVQLLLDYGADPNMVDINGCSALNFAYYSRSSVVIEALENAGAKEVDHYCQF
ncbi:ankyrin repeat domain-containing protein [Paenibacillus illinoisensis]|uniref:ankyrin repeat domain-containing protein n=1 Tax=Paenibacillus illinoisensis TaxID=59845 RepID=UPI003D28D0C2